MNRLADETSPYLLQHADNPVDWYPWSEEAFTRAREEQKPILLSIGYSACHWCHVMAHESFEDPETAAVMNRHFINIKVDREERPDVDQIYQIAHQLIARRAGGWPLTVFLTPDEKLPFFAGTYFPDQPRHGMPAFSDLLERVAAYAAANPAEIQSNGAAVADALKDTDPQAPGGATIDGGPIDEVRNRLAADFDGDFGGFGNAPKFPHTGNLERLLRHWRRTVTAPEPDVEALYMCALTMKRMADGGIYDHVGGGFCRYAVDRTWTIPHFEKMLYDNGPLLALYAQVWQASGDELFRRVAIETADWVLRDMRDEAGGFYSTLDADSEGEEGRFYVWTPEDVRAELPADEFEVLAPHFGLDGAPNFEGSSWHLCVRKALDEVARDRDMPEPSARTLLDRGRAALLASRNNRVWPGRDEKILTAWNALMIRGLAIAADPLQRHDLAHAAATAVDFITNNAIIDGRLMASFKDGRARFPAYLDDHAYLLDALIELVQVRWDAQHLGLAVWAAEGLLTHFLDEERGGFYFTAHDHETLIHRPRPFADDATPSGNGVAALALGRLGHMLGEPRYLEAAESTLEAAWPAIERYPHGHATLITALEEYLDLPQTIVIRGPESEIERWRATIRSIYAPRRIVLAIPDDETGLPGALETRAAGESALAYVCRGSVCDAPVDSLEALIEQIRDGD